MTQKRIGIYAGTYDPITKGHLHIIERASKLVDHLIIGVADNPGKKPLFNVTERMEMVQTDIDNMHDKYCPITVESFDNLLIHFARDHDAACVFRGLRASSDFEYEFQLANMNRALSPNIESVFLTPAEHLSYISSSLVREISSLDGDVSKFAPANVVDALSQKFNKS